MQKAKFNIKGLSGRSGLLESKLKNQKGVFMVRVNNESEKAVIIFDTDKTSKAELTKIIESVDAWEVGEEFDNSSEAKAKNLKENNREEENGRLLVAISKSLILGVLAGASIMSVLLNILFIAIILSRP